MDTEADNPAGELVLASEFEGGLGQRAALLVSHERRFLDRVCTRVLEVGA